jgi:hypothetical protein
MSSFYIFLFFLVFGLPLALSLSLCICAFLWDLLFFLVIVKILLGKTVYKGICFNTNTARMFSGTDLGCLFLRGGGQI